MSYVALKASEVVLDGHREVLLAVCFRTSIQRQAAGDRYTQENSSGNRVNGAAGGASCASLILELLLSHVARQTTFTKAVWLHETRTASRISL